MEHELTLAMHFPGREALLGYARDAFAAADEVVATLDAARTRRELRAFLRHAGGAARPSPTACSSTRSTPTATSAAWRHYAASSAWSARRRARACPRRFAAGPRASSSRTVVSVPAGVIARCDIGEPVSWAPCQCSALAGTMTASPALTMCSPVAVADLADAGDDVEHLVVRVPVPACPRPAAELHQRDAEVVDCLRLRSAAAPTPVHPRR